MDMAEQRENVAKWMSSDPIHGLSLPVGSDNVALHGSGTQAIFQALLALREGNAKTALLVTPLYFSASGSCEILGFDQAFFPTLLEADGLPDVGALVHRILRDKPDVVLATNPIYPTGVLWPARALERVLRACEEVDAVLVLDASQGALDWAPSPERALGSVRIDALDNLILVQSPAKALFLNGAKFAHTVTSIQRADDIRENDEISNGSLSYLQALLASSAYAALGAGPSSPEGREVAAAREHNVARFRQHHEDLIAMLDVPGLRFTKTQSGVLTMLVCEGTRMTESEEKAFTFKVLQEHGVQAMPGSVMYVLEEGNPIAFRFCLALGLPILRDGVRAIESVYRREVIS
ncbi:MAG: histidinol-phosphate aminotransferase [Thermoplasmata archaeon]|jgi:aspartate/methionine/tyrosine aminotransferase|nr:histidinol-phosphate aminotransferase [Thermoplasmata archaeon]